MVLTIEQGFHDKDPYSSIQKMFIKNRLFKPWDNAKTPKYYKSILEIMVSMEFKHFLYRNKSDPQYSTAKILKVLSLPKWGNDLSKL